MPKLSIVVPVYNTEQFLPACIESILCSQFADFELLLVDNASTDGSCEICERYAQRDRRIRILTQRTPGVSAARNCGIAAAEGEFIGFVDSDDTVETNLFSELIDLYDTEDTVLSCVGVFVDAEGKPPAPQNADGKSYRLTAAEAAAFLLSGKYYKGFLPNKLFRSSVIKKYRLRLAQDIAYCEDVLFVAAYLQAAAGSVHYHAVPLYHYHIHGSNVSENGFSPRMLSGLTAFSRVEEIAAQSWPELVPEVRASQAGMGIYALRSIARSGAGAEHIPMLGGVVRKNRTAYLASRDTGRKAKLLCRLCCLSPRLFVGIAAHL